MNAPIDRRNFLKTTAAFSAGVTSMTLFTQQALSHPLAEERATIVGPREGFAPHIGTLASMMAFMRGQVLRSAKDLKMEQLDFLLDDKSNSIGAMLLHLAATERYYQLHTFDKMKWGTWDDTIKQKWETASKLGDEGRKTIKGNNLEYYVNILSETRQHTIDEFKKRDDKWLMEVDNDWFWGPTNNYCKWFHVCEHEANHNGQIKLVKGRLPGAKAIGD